MGIRRRRWTSIFALTALSTSTSASAIAADDDAKVKIPRVMMESGEVTNVIDAFDDDDPFDLNISLGFQYETKSARILRESTIFEPGLTTGGYVSNMMTVGEYTENTSRLIPQLDIGIYKDLAFYARFPIVLSNTRAIDEIDGSAGQVNTVLQGAPGEVLFNLPFQAPDRSGLEYVALGLDVNIFNQARDWTKPTWLFGVETRISAGEAMHACTSNPIDDQVECADPADVNRNNRFDADVASPDDPNINLEGRNIDTDRGPGITRGTVGLEIHTMMSKRVKYIEPYGGVSALFEFQQGENDFGKTDLEGALVNHPPLRGKITLGIMFIPWEDREDFGRLTFDLQFAGEYISEGRDYSEMFDALGSSSVRSLRDPKWARFRPACAAGEFCDPASVVDTGSDKSYFTGLSVVEAHGSYRMAGSATWQASEYFKLTAGLGFRFDQSHGISHDQPCNPDFTDNVGESGPCHTGDSATTGIRATGIPNPAFRAPINSVGRRFYVDESMTFDVFAKGVVMF